MAETASPATGRSYGVARVCRAWEVARSSFYAARRPEAEAATEDTTTTSRAAVAGTATRITAMEAGQVEAEATDKAGTPL